MAKNPPNPPKPPTPPPTTPPKPNPPKPPTPPPTTPPKPNPPTPAPPTPTTAPRPNPPTPAPPAPTTPAPTTPAPAPPAPTTAPRPNPPTPAPPTPTTAPRPNPPTPAPPTPTTAPRPNPPTPAPPTPTTPAPTTPAPAPPAPTTPAPTTPAPAPPAPTTPAPTTPAPATATGAQGLSEAQIRSIVQNQINSMKVVTQDTVRTIVSNQVNSEIQDRTFTKKEANDKFTTKSEVRDVIDSIGITKDDANKRFIDKNELNNRLDSWWQTKNVGKFTTESEVKTILDKWWADKNPSKWITLSELDKWWADKNPSKWITLSELDKWWNDKNPSKWITQADLNKALEGLKGGGGKVSADDVKNVLDEVMPSNKFKNNLAKIFGVDVKSLDIKDFIKEGLFSYYGANKSKEDQDEIKDLLKTIKTIRDDLENLSELGIGIGGQEPDGGTYDIESEGETALDAILNVPVTTRSAAAGALSKIKIPPPNTNPADITYPNNAQPIFMPNINRRVKVEIDRITMSLVKTAKEFLEAGIDFNVINYVPNSQRIDDENGLVYYDPTELNVPGNPTSSFASEVINGIVEELIKLLNYGDRANNKFNYYQYLNLFDLTYDNNGTPSYTLNVEIEDVIMDNLRAVKVNENDNNTSANPERSLEVI